MANELDPAPAPKKWYTSKVFWVNILALVVMIFPKGKAFVDQYFGLDNAAMGWAVINMVLRLLTKGKVEISLLILFFVCGAMLA
jgi:hypothetical protein